jgi:hypothetical protein
LAAEIENEAGLFSDNTAFLLEITNLKDVKITSDTANSSPMSNVV